RQLQRLTVGRRLREGMLAEAQLEDAVQRVDHILARLCAAAALAVGAGDLGDRRDNPAIAAVLIDDRQMQYLAHARHGNPFGRQTPPSDVVLDGSGNSTRQAAGLVLAPEASLTACRYVRRRPSAISPSAQDGVSTVSGTHPLRRDAAGG